MGKEKKARKYDIREDESCYEVLLPSEDLGESTKAETHVQVWCEGYEGNKPTYLTCVDFLTFLIHIMHKQTIGEVDF